jgi:GntR family transcriptional regulator
MFEQSIKAITVLDRASPLPLWAQLLRDLRARLAAGEFTGRFPTDGELVTAYRVSRQTARDAVRRLTDEGLLERERGRGTRVRPSAFEQRTGGTLEGLFDHVAARGLLQTSITRAQDERTDPVAAGALELALDTRLVYIERLRLVDSEPLALDRAWLPAAIARPLLDVDLAHTDLYAELAARCDVVLQSASERVRPVAPGPADRRLLKLPAGAAAFSIERLTRDRHGPVEWRHSLVRGDRWSIRLELTPGERTPAALLWAAVDPR